MHPFAIDDSTVQTSNHVESRLQAEVMAIETFVHGHGLPARPDAMKKVRKQFPVLAALVDFWWQGVEEDLEPMGLSPTWLSPPPPAAQASPQGGIHLRRDSLSFQ